MTAPEGLPVKVLVDNWPGKRRKIENTVIKTQIIDPAGAAGPKNIQICNYEPTRVRLQVMPVDAAVALTMESPGTSPDVSTASTAPQGGYLPVTTVPYDFGGPDVWFLNALQTVTRVLIIKEYE